MTGTIEIRAAVPAEYEVIGTLARETWPAAFGGILSPAQIEYMLGKMYSLETLRTELREKQIRFFRLFVNAQFAGFASFGPTSEPGVVKLHKCYLLPELHARGHGSRLLQHCEQEARKLGSRRMILAVNKQNAKAIAAYQRNGFAVTESVVTDFGSGFVMDDYLMAKNLDL